MVSKIFTIKSKRFFLARLCFSALPCLAHLFVVQPIFAKTSFAVQDINSSNQILYSSESNLPGAPNISNLYMVSLGKEKVEGESVLLTCAPETMELLSGNVVQLRNPLGTARYSLSRGTLEWVERAKDFPTVWTGCSRQVESPDGKMICREDDDGSLSLVDFSNGIQVEISVKSSSSPRPLVKWSADSKVFLYEEDGVVYFASTDAALKNLLPPSSMRKIGEGTLDSVQWVGRSIYYACSDILFKIDEGELYTRGLYYAVVGSGSPVARLPESFDPFHDRFWISPDAQYLVHVSQKKSVAFYSIPKKFGFLGARRIESLVGLSGSILDVNVLWTDDDFPLLWIENLSYSKGKKTASVYSMEKGLNLIENYDEPRLMGLSPNGKNIAFSYGRKLEIRKIDGWSLLSQSKGEKVLSFKWLDEDSIIAGGEETLFKLTSTADGWSKKDLYLSSATTACWDGSSVKAWPGDGKKCFVYDRQKKSWKSCGQQNQPVKKTSVASGKFRAYIGECPNQNFDDAIFVRSLVTPAFTYPLIPVTAQEQNVKGRVSLIFDATEGNEGLSLVLSALEKFDMKATFFVNGEFIRRYPMETCQIVASGNKCASGFFTTADLLDRSFRVDSDFIRRGLARNEDEFFAATGKELELLWHAPLYGCTEMMKQAGEDSGYNYVDSWRMFSDRVSFEEALMDSAKQYLTADEVVEKIRENLFDGMVISVDVGNINGSRGDYVYERIQLLIKTILSQGYEFK